MSLSKISVPIVTDAAGADVSTVRCSGVRLHAVRIEVGTLSTPDITIKLQPANTTVLAVTGVASDVTKYPSVLAQNSSGVDIVGSGVAVPVFDRLEITTAGGGDTLTGRVVLLVER